MIKIRLITVIFLLGIVFCMGLLQTAESAETGGSTDETTVNETPEELSGSQVTFGSFITDLHDGTYLNIGGNISKGVQDKFTENFGILTHIPLYSRNFESLKCRWATAISGGIGLNNFYNNEGKFSLAELPTVLGVSLLFAPEKSENLLALTAGGIIKPVQRLNGYSLGNTFPQGSKTVTRPVREISWFFAITISYDVPEALKKLRAALKP